MFKFETKNYKFSDVFEIKAGGDIPKEDFSNTKTDFFNIPIYANSLMNEGLYGYTHTPKITTDCVTVTGRGSVGYAEPRYNSFYPIVRLLVLIDKNIKTNKKYVSEYINQMKIFHETTGVPQLTAPQLGSYLIDLPSFDMQNKIGNLFSTMDKLIEDKEILIDQYKNEKESIYTKFIQNNTTENTLKLSEITTYKASTLNMNDVIEEGKYIVYGANSVVGNANTYISENPYISIVKDGAGVGRVFKCNEETNILGTMGCINIGSEVDIDFVFNFMNNINWNKYITGSTIPHVYYSDFKNIKVPNIPLQKQKKIGNLLSSMDKIIDLHKQELDQLKLKKKYYLNKIFD